MSMTNVRFYIVMALLPMSLNVSAQKYYTTTTGSWEGSNMWGITTSGIGNAWATTVLVDGDVIQIDDDTILDTDLTINVDVTIIIDATLSIEKKLRLTANSTIIFTENGQIVGTGPGNSEKVSFGGTNVWSGGDGPVTGPGGMDKDYNGTLPISLISFVAESTDNGVRLRWATSSEENNDYFTIERSRDGINFEEVIKINGAGYSTDVRSYDYVDSSPFFGSSYYRLSQTDFDGSQVTFKMIAVSYSSPTAMNIYPNPAQRGGYIKVLIEAEVTEAIDVSVYERTGRLIKKDKILGPGFLSIPENIDAGLYILEVKIGDLSKSTRLVIN